MIYEPLCAHDSMISPVTGPSHNLVYKCPLFSIGVLFDHMFSINHAFHPKLHVLVFSGCIVID